MSIADQVRDLVAPAVGDAGFALWDVEFSGGMLRVFVDRSEGTGLDDLGRLTQRLSRLLDEHDPIPGRYLLEVSSPGVERNLRTAEHYRRSVGETVSVKTRPDVEGERRRTGVLLVADDEGFVVRPEPGGPEQRLAYTDVERARTVFAWGPGPKPGAPTPRAKQATKRKKAATS
ncbi:MAG: ribosome maturation factor RimP [Actinobacteria bacterium]|nr:ribosome maturation factor RimP [Actinomycetota bacterium]